MCHFLMPACQLPALCSTLDELRCLDEDRRGDEIPEQISEALTAMAPQQEVTAPVTMQDGRHVPEEICVTTSTNTITFTILKGWV